MTNETQVASFENMVVIRETDRFVKYFNWDTEEYIIESIPDIFHVRYAKDVFGFGDQNLDNCASLQGAIQCMKNRHQWSSLFNHCIKFPASPSST